MEGNKDKNRFRRQEIASDGGGKKEATGGRLLLENFLGAMELSLTNKSADWYTPQRSSYFPG